jgi:predicted ATPase
VPRKPSLLRGRDAPAQRRTRLAGRRAHTEAEKSFREAIEIAQRQEAKGWELRAATSLGRLLRKQERVTEAREVLAPVYNWFTEGFDTADWKDAKALLDQLTV